VPPRSSFLGPAGDQAPRWARLRALFDDPLFVRTGRSMEPTARALDIAQLL